MALAEQIELPPTTTQSAEANLAWKKIVLDLCTEHLRDGAATGGQSAPKPSNRRSAFRLPTSDSLHVLDTDQLWQSLEFQNKSILPATKRRLRRLIPARKQTDTYARGPHENRVRGGNAGEKSAHRDGSDDSSSSRDPTAGNGHNPAPKPSREPEAGASAVEAPAAYQNLEEAESSDEEPVSEKDLKKRRLIAALEEKNIAPKSWTLRGEVGASNRPKDSLLESTLEFDTTAKPNFLAIGDLNGAIEDMVKTRIADGRFDDVVPREAPITDVEKYESEAHDALSEKPRKGLGELYEEEFRDSGRAKQELPSPGTTAGGADKETLEVYAAFERVVQKLDALSSVSVTPLINDVAKTAPEAVPEDEIKEEAMVSVEEGVGNTRDPKNGQGNSSRNQRKRKRRKRVAV